MYPRHRLVLVIFASERDHGSRARCAAGHLIEHFGGLPVLKGVSAAGRRRMALHARIGSAVATFYPSVAAPTRAA